MGLQTKTIGRVTTDHGPYDPNQSYGKKFLCELFGCVWESLHDNNNTAPAVWDGGDTITPNLVDWKKQSGSYESWLMNKDKPATTGTTGDYPYNGMGRVKLAKNIVNGVNTLTQDMFYKGESGARVPNTNTIFVIQYDYVLGEDITVPANCILIFEGGNINTNSYTIFLSNNNKIYGNSCIIKGKLDTDTCTSNISLSINSVSNIEIYDVIFDGDYTGTCSASGDYAGHELISINESSNILFNNCVIQNWHQSWKSETGSNCHVMSITTSNFVTLNKFKLLNIRPEAPTFKYCNHIKINDYYIGNDSSHWTGLHIFYSEDVILTNSYIYTSPNQGSTINCTAKNVVIENCTFEEGQGLDFSNEAEDQTFNSSNIVIRNCNIKNTNGYIIYTNPTPGQIENILLSGCKCVTKLGMNTNNTYGLVVENCDITVTDSNGDVLRGSGVEGVKYGKFVLTNNKIATARFIGLGTPVDYSDYDIVISNNSITCSSIFLYINGDVHCNNIVIKNNNIISDKFIYKSSGDLFANKMTICDNVIKLEDSLNLYNSNIDVTVKNNIFNSTFIACDNLKLINNLWVAKETAYDALWVERGALLNATIEGNNFNGNKLRWYIANPSDTFIFKDNISFVFNNYTGVSNFVKNLYTYNNSFHSSVNNVGQTSERPTIHLHIGYSFFDTTLGKVIYVKIIDTSTTPATITWVDAIGTPV